ncbi:septal ring lytic transglycosylase RlpA family protein [Psychrilyobacter sp.]|uniref:septal ring lytic transglycosylase RlpA family protein n=1 Tax=Psychrilyobacter sp. TaxID=2586924 RepID=UPI00301AE4A8
MKKLVLAIIIAIALVGCYNTPKKTVSYPKSHVQNSRFKVGNTIRGKASWYGDFFHGKKTASGEKYNMYNLTAANKTLPFGTIVRVKNLDNGKSVKVKINDRGPYVKGRMIDLSRAAFEKIAPLRVGVLNIEVTILDASNTFRYKH